MSWIKFDNWQEFEVIRLEGNDTHTTNVVKFK